MITKEFGNIGKGGGKGVSVSWRLLMPRLVQTSVVILLLFMSGCAGEEQFYQGMYEGFGNVDRQRRSEDPSYHPPLERERPSYQEYKQEREEALGRTGSIEEDPAAR